MAARATARSDIKAGLAQPDRTVPVRSGAARAAASGPRPARPLSPAAAPVDAVARLVETGSGPGAAASRRAQVAHLQQTHGNRFAGQVVAEFRARDQAQAPETSADFLQPEAAAPPKATVGTPAAATVSPRAAEKSGTVAAASKAASAASAPGPAAASPAAAAPAAVAPASAPSAAAPAAAAPAAGAPAAAAAGAAAAAPTPTTGAAPAGAAAPAAEGAAAEGAAAGAKEGEAAPAAAAAAPASPATDPAFQAVVARARAVAHKQGHNSPAKKKAAEAQAAAPPPANDISSQAAAAQVGKMDAQEPAPFDRAAFKTALLAKIADITPKNLEQADEFKKSGAAGAVKGAVTDEVKASKESAQGPIKTANTEAPDASAAQPKPVTPMPPTEAGPAPPDIGASEAAPKPKTEGEVSMQAESQGLDRQMSDANVTETQLKKSNEPDFEQAADAKTQAQTHAAEAPGVYREQEASIIAGAQGESVAGAAMQTAQMHAVRGKQFGKIAGDQLDTQQADREARDRVGKRIEEVGSSRVDLQACKLEYSIVSPK